MNLAWLSQCVRTCMPAGIKRKQKRTAQSRVYSAIVAKEKFLRNLANNKKKKEKEILSPLSCGCLQP